MKKIKWGILSTAKIAQTALIPGINKSKNSILHSVASRNSLKARKFASKYLIPNHYGNYKDLFKDNNVDITMTLTTPNCPEAQTIPEKVADVVSLLKGVNEVKVEITWDPPWTQDNMTDAAKLELGLM